MKAHILVGILTIFAAVACRQAPEPHPLPPPIPQSVSFEQDIKPILDSRCLACHGCFDAPCQLKFESAQGLLRGAHHQEVYNGTRSEAQRPTRLGIDAHTEQQWRELGFHSVLNEDEQGQSLLYKMLQLGKKHPFPPNSKLPDNIELGITRQNQCPTNDQFDTYAKQHPQEGMPLGMAALSDQEYAKLAAWLEQGAPLNTKPRSISQADAEQIQQWESYLNQSSKERQLVARWLYEHLFLAHLYFADQGQKTRFFTLLRSSTPPGQPIQPIATAQPNGPYEGAIYYRLKAIDDTLVHKRHIALLLDEAKRERIESLFFANDWHAEQLPDYAYHARANPFITFAAIPAKARYQFMLDNAEYFVRTFIRGPVCRGQIATDVIRDHFWTLFQSPEHDLFITHPEYAEKAAPLLGLPGQDDDLLEAGTNWFTYQDKRNRYAELRTEAYRQYAPKGAALEHIWDGEGFNSNALLTIFRHHDSASVQRGLFGKLPQTIWWMDYPLLERTYYELVVNFDVFGNLAHQLQTRLYFDLIRNGSEQNLLRLLPPQRRQHYLEQWYQGTGLLKRKFSYAPMDSQSPATVQYETDKPYTELGQMLLDQFADINTFEQDPLNRCQQGVCARSGQSPWIQQADQQLAELSNWRLSTTPALHWLPEVTLLRVHKDQEQTLYSLLRNRAHSNVAFMLGESLRHQEERDSLTLYPGLLGSYPNFIFDLPAQSLSLWLEAMKGVKTDEDFEQVVHAFGIRRTHPRFWQVLEAVQAWHLQQQPLEAGVLDINRYKNL
ncbi:fatty acid cis/trans isomerase [Bowmanella sp. Y26]|uniref:fatty acid cis/trans isomerase n=1 Tax=Bowmanella yangjiangensis TaxID=2811230 RepID=UPI001BDC1338|nr:fatty acid cis/trans isomerase [Bowmanella yangjiangensis]MBT1062358.1 fatty acid cis/trans isomerase [Bowmanella yangjiangensis]